MGPANPNVTAAIVVVFTAAASVLLIALALESSPLDAIIAVATAAALLGFAGYTAKALRGGRM
jgi:hypothetical protein